MKVLAASYNREVEHVYRQLADAIFQDGGSLELLECDSPDEVAVSIEDVDVLIAWRTPVTAEVMDAAPNLRLVMASGSGYDHIDVEAARERSIAVSHSGVYNAQDVAEHAVTLVLACTRRLPNILSADITGRWPVGVSLPPAHRFGSRTVLVVGYGAIGSKVARLLDLLGFRVLVCDPNKTESDLEADSLELVGFGEGLRQADAVTLHLRLDETTAGIIDSAALGQMRESSCLVNTSRGGLVDVDAVAEALRSGHLTCAALDVLPVEPPMPNDVAINTPNLMITGHSAGVTEEAEHAWRDALLAGVRAFGNGGPIPNRVV